MKKLLSLPPNLVKYFHQIEQADPEFWFCTSDPIDRKLGSGGGTAWLLESCMRNDEKCDFDTWLSSEKRILLHAGGQSRRLPAYAPSGKILTPIPVYRWGRGQNLAQNLLSLQLPLYEKIMSISPDNFHTLIVSGDVLIRTEQPLQPIPEADIVCYGLWVEPSLAKNHGVFVMSKDRPDQLDRMLQKPSIEQLDDLMGHSYFLMDIGVWLLSDKAVKLLVERSKRGGEISYYDLYSDLGGALGLHPVIEDPDVNALKVAILPLPGGEFYHYGTSREMISSTVAVQNRVLDQRAITHHKVKPHPAMFTQNAVVEIPLHAENSQLWVENSHVASGWTISHRNIITGVPRNSWSVYLPPEVCVDVVPVGESGYAVRPYGFSDKFRGNLSDSATMYLGQPMPQWLAEHQITIEEVEGADDLQSAKIFPVCNDLDQLGQVLRWMIDARNEGREIWIRSQRMSADELAVEARIDRLTAQRRDFRNKNWTALAANYRSSVFYQLNLREAANDFARFGLPLPEALPADAPLMTRVSDEMFRSAYYERQLQSAEAAQHQAEAFRLMREGLIARRSLSRQPRLSVYADQIVWARCPVRIDLAGGWTDTPPYCLNEGGSVLNLAVNLNGQSPIQVYIKASREHQITLRSIDLGATEIVRSYDELRRFDIVGSPFSIPKAALVLAGFHPNFSMERYSSLEQQLKVFGGGIEVTLLSAIPAGSGLGTSSILASTMLGAINDFCDLGWDKQEIGNRTLLLEQLLTTGGGWQDQYGGILPGIKLLQTESGWHQTPVVRWLPSHLFVSPEYKDCHLLYYTGLTRTAKHILGEIVKGMFLNSTPHLELLREMKQHTLDMFEAIQRNDYEKMSHLIGRTWKQNQALDSGTNPPQVQAIINKVADLCNGYKLPGAGGGGYLYMAAKDPEAAIRIRKILSETPVNDKARFVDMSLSETGLEVTRN